MKRWLFLLLLFSAFPAQAVYRYYVNQRGFCERFSPQESYQCFLDYWGEDSDTEFRMERHNNAICGGGSAYNYCILSRTKGSGKEWHNGLGNSIVREDVECPVERETAGKRKGAKKVFAFDVKATKGMYHTKQFEYSFCNNGCLYEGGLTINESLPTLKGTMMYFEQTGRACINNDKDEEDKDAPPYKTPPEDDPKGDGGEPTEWLTCPSHRGVYKKGTEPTGDCLKSPEKPKDPKEPEQPKPPEQPPEQPKPPEQPPEKKPDDDDKNSGGHHHGGGGGGSGGGGAAGQPGENGSGGGSGGGGGGSGSGSKPGGGSGGGSEGSGKNDGKPGGSGDTDGNKPGKPEGKDNDNTGPNGKDDGKGADDKDGKGSGISGGNCMTGKAPDCKGDAVQCYIAREQWRTSCLAESGRTDLGAKGDCKTGKKPVCRGDATTCYQLQLQFEQTCAATGGGEGDLDGAKEGFGDSIGEREIAGETGLGKAPTTDDIKNRFGKEVDVAGYANKFDDRGFLNNHACMAPQKYTVSGISFTIDWSMLCLFLTYVGYFVVAVGYFLGFRIVSGGFD